MDCSNPQSKILSPPLKREKIWKKLNFTKFLGKAEQLNNFKYFRIILEKMEFWIYLWLIEEQTDFY